MAKYIISYKDGVPYCTLCGRVMPECGPNAINIDLSEIRHCYFCGASMEPFTYPTEGEDINERCSR